MNYLLYQFWSDNIGPMPLPFSTGGKYQEEPYFDFWLLDNFCTCPCRAAGPECPVFKWIHFVNPLSKGLLQNTSATVANWSIFALCLCFVEFTVLWASLGNLHKAPEKDPYWDPNIISNHHEHVQCSASLHVPPGWNSSSRGLFRLPLKAPKDKGGSLPRF